MLELSVAASIGDIDAVNNLLARGLPINAPDYDGRTMLHKSVADGRQEVVQALLDKGATPGVSDSWGASPLLEACELNQLGICEALCARGAKLDLGTDDLELVLNAAENSDAKLRLMCFKAGVSPNTRDVDMRTVLHHAAASHNWKAGHNLLKIGADVNALDRCVCVPLLPQLPV